MAQQTRIQYIRLYTDGSVARKLEVATPAERAKAPRPKKRKKIIIHVDPVATLGIVTAVVMLIVMTVSMFNLYGAQQETAAMAQYVDQLREENAALWEQYRTGYDLEKVEQTAWALGMVPVEQVKHVQVQIAQPESQVEPSGWQRLQTYLTGLFA